MRVVLFWS
jgi:hypothetical protein